MGKVAFLPFSIGSGLIAGFIAKKGFAAKDAPVESKPAALRYDIAAASNDDTDTILVPINPVERPGTPRRAAEIMSRLNEVFNLSDSLAGPEEMRDMIERARMCFQAPYL